MTVLLLPDRVVVTRSTTKSTPRASARTAVQRSVERFTVPESAPTLSLAALTSSRILRFQVSRASLSTALEHLLRAARVQTCSLPRRRGGNTTRLESGGKLGTRAAAAKTTMQRVTRVRLASVALEESSRSLTLHRPTTPVWPPT